MFWKICSGSLLSPVSAALKLSSKLLSGQRHEAGNLINRIASSQDCLSPDKFSSLLPHGQLCEMCVCVGGVVHGGRENIWPCEQLVGMHLLVSITLSGQQKTVISWGAR